jgi:hypothetical protein
MEYTLTVNSRSPGYDYLAVGPDVPVFAKWARDRDEPVTLNQEAADAVSTWLAKYDSWPVSMLPVRLTPLTRAA